MRVYLLSTSGNDDLARHAAATCMNKEKDMSNHSLENAIASGHLSVLEHIYFTFKIEGISRTCSHQLVRHRLASYSMLSQRIKLPLEEPLACNFVAPESIAYQESYAQEYEQCLRIIQQTYNWLVKAGVPEEDARYILPNATRTKLVMSMNARSFITQSRLRLCNKAQWEIRNLYNMMRGCIVHSHPTIARLAVPPCVSDKCTESKPCGKPYILDGLNQLTEKPKTPISSTVLIQEEVDALLGIPDIVDCPDKPL